MVALDLAGRRVVVVGGGRVGGRRAADLLGSGADVLVVAPALHPELASLVAAGHVRWRAGGYAGPADLEGAWLVHTATGDPCVDRAVRADAEASRVWCVDAGDAEASPAHLPAQREVGTPDGPVAVAVHGAGDPGRSVAVRDGLVAALQRGEVDLRRRRPRPGAGWVALVGGGPGADGLLTVRGAVLLASADVVVVDRLAPHGVVDALPDGVRVVDVGKAPGRHTVPQAEIDALLVREALAGHGVVRLKGGDPYVLGRGGEERLACEAAGVRVEVVPGVSSAVAAPAAAGIPVTHRGLARGFTVVTGHEEIAGLPPGSDHTVVVLMGVARLAETARLLVEHGRSAATPAAVVERGFLPSQRTTVGTLGDIAERARAAGASSPAVVVVGDVVALSPHAAEVLPGALAAAGPARS
jgi:uroporphyrin-III C-methyltransferase/precorrin-2 dehydrogenase/sirohydrochlorin ferrochelatase